MKSNNHYLSQRQLHEILDVKFSKFKEDGLTRFRVSKLELRSLYDPGRQGSVTLDQVFNGAPSRPEQNAHTLPDHVAVAAERWGLRYREDVEERDVLIFEDKDEWPVVAGREC